MIPRIRGCAGQADVDDPSHPDFGKWFYQVSLWTLDGETRVGDPWLFGPFESEAKACERGKQIIRDLSEHLEKEFTGKASGKFLDLKNGGVLRPWEEN